jgi:sodium/bile acid cotransporter 7
MNWLTKNWFILGILLAIVFGFLFSEAGIAMNRNSVMSTVIVVILFVIMGLTLPSETIISGLKDYKLHLFIQTFIFIIIPLFFYISSLPFRNLMGGRVVIGIYALAVLPTTISSCIVFTQLSKGNTVGTMFNASLANAAGVLISPLLLSFFLRTSGQGLPADEIAKILLNLLLKMLLPIIAGQILRRVIKEFAVKNKKRFGIVSNVLILLIIFLSFAKTAANPAFIDNLKVMVLPFIYLAGAHIFLLLLIFFLGRLFKFSRKNIVSALYAAPQKTLAMGVPLLSTYFAANQALLGIALLPLIFYHPWQLLVAGFMKPYLSRWAAEDEESASSGSGGDPGRKSGGTE